MKKNEKILIKYLDDFGLDIFSLKDLENANFLNKRQLILAIQSLKRSEYIDSIEKEKYCRHNFKDHFVIGSFVVSDGVISYWNAMNYHGLTEQIPNVIFVKTSKRKKNTNYFGVKYIFSRKRSICISGFKTQGYGNHQFRISNINRTIVDCFDKPQLSGGYAEIIKAFFNAKLNAKDMVKYCKEENKISLTKRLAFLTELLKKPNMNYFIKYAQSVVNQKYSLFEINGEPQGKTNRKWRLVLNLSEEEIKEMAKS